MVAGVTAGLAESNDSLPPGLWLMPPAGWLPRTWISCRTLCSVIEYGLPLPFLYRKSIRHVKNWVMRCSCGYLSGAWCRLFAYGPADANAIPKPHHLLPPLKCRLVLPFWYQHTQVVLEKRPLNRCSSSSSSYTHTHWLIQRHNHRCTAIIQVNLC